MNVKYFTETDTAFIQFSERDVEETREVSANVYIDLDRQGNLVNMTIEHAKLNANLPTVIVEEVKPDAA